MRIWHFMDQNRTDFFLVQSWNLECRVLLAPTCICLEDSSTSKSWKNVNLTTSYLLCCAVLLSSLVKVGTMCRMQNEMSCSWFNKGSVTTHEKSFILFYAMKSKSSLDYSCSRSCWNRCSVPIPNCGFLKKRWF